MAVLAPGDSDVTLNEGDVNLTVLAIFRREGLRSDGKKQTCKKKRNSTSKEEFHGAPPARCWYPALGRKGVLNGFAMVRNRKKRRQWAAALRVCRRAVLN